MRLIIESNRFRLLHGQCFLVEDPLRHFRQMGISALQNSLAEFGIQNPGTFGLDIMGVEAVDLRSGESVRMPFCSAGVFELSQDDLKAGDRRIGIDQGALVWIKVVDSKGSPSPDCDLSLVLPGRSVRINPAKHGSCLVCPRYQCWLVVEGPRSSQRESWVSLPTEGNGSEQTITLTA